MRRFFVMSLRRMDTRQAAMLAAVYRLMTSSRVFKGPGVSMNLLHAPRFSCSVALASLLCSLGCSTESATASPRAGRTISQPRTGAIDAGTKADSGDTAASDPAAWANMRVQLLISQMTLSEKIAQLQNTAPAIPRLNLPAYQYWNEGLHGVLNGGATSFPQAIALGATWDPELVQRVASAIGDEARGFNASFGKGLTYWSPVINMLRDPRWGRYEEAYSEDPYLMSQLGVAFVKGLQGDHPKYLKAISTPKHFALNNSEYNRHTGSSDIDEQTLHEYYLPAFEATIRDGHAFSVMSAYNSLNGTPCSANPLLLRDLLRETWGFSGYVVSDCDAIDDIVNGHHWVASLPQAAGMALQAGTDLNCGLTYPQQLQASIALGFATEGDVDTALARVLRARFVLGEFDSTEEVPFKSIDASVIESAKHANLALEAAREAIVLLKNEKSFLPLDRTKIRSIAVIGPHSNDVTLGGYSGWPNHTVSPLQGITSKLSDVSGASIVHVDGCTVLGQPDDTSLAAAAQAAAAADVAVVLAGTSQEVMNEERDRADWSLPSGQQALLSAVYDANPQTVLVLITGGPLGVDWADDNIPAILTAFYDGQAQGTAIADVLFGDAEPGGRLSTTWYKQNATLPPIGDYDIRKGRTYLYLDDAPLYPFGFGLSYTSFAYGSIQMSPSSIGTNGTTSISVNVTNTGKRVGDEVVQLYTHETNATTLRPFKQLRRFQRVHLEPGEMATVTFQLSARDLAHWDIGAHGWKTSPGAFDVFVGASSADLRAHSVLTVSD